MHPNLTPTERKVLHLVADGMTNKEIASKTGQSEHTVKFHVNSLMSKFDVTSRLQVVVSALKQGMLQLCDIMPEVGLVVTRTNNHESPDSILANAPPRPHYDNT